MTREIPKCCFDLVLLTRVELSKNSFDFTDMYIRSYTEHVMSLHESLTLYGYMNMLYTLCDHPAVKSAKDIVRSASTSMLWQLPGLQE